MEIPTINVDFSTNTVQYATNTAVADVFDKKQRTLQKQQEKKNWKNEENKKNV